MPASSTHADPEIPLAPLARAVLPPTTPRRPLAIAQGRRLGADAPAEVEVDPMPRTRYSSAIAMAIDETAVLAAWRRQPNLPRTVASVIGCLHGATAPG